MISTFVSIIIIYLFTKYVTNFVLYLLQKNKAKTNKFSTWKITLTYTQTEKALFLLQNILNWIY